MRTEQPVDRRTLLRRGAVTAAGVWTIPVISSLSSPAVAASEPPAPAAECFSQTFTHDDAGHELTTHGQYFQWLSVDLHTAFSAITAITARFTPALPLDDGRSFFFGLEFFVGNSGFGRDWQVASGDPQPYEVHIDPAVVISGSGAHYTVEELLLDGQVRASWGLNYSSDDPGNDYEFTLQQIEFEVCGTPA